MTPSRADLLDERDAAIEEAAAARRAAANAETRAQAAEEALNGDQAVGEARERTEAALRRAEDAEAACENAVNQLADVLVVLARGGYDIERAHAGALVEYALREAENRPCEPARCIA